MFRKKNVKPIDKNIKKFVFEYNDYHFEIHSDVNTVKYKNVIPPRDGGELFPDNFFVEKVYILTETECLNCIRLISEFLKHTKLRSRLDILPPGATRNQYVRIEFHSGKTYYYSDTRVAKSGFRIKKASPNNYFIKLYEYIKQFCSFPEFPLNFVESSDVINDSDERYFNETLWICSKCMTGNLLSNKACIKCGQNRTF